MAHHMAGRQASGGRGLVFPKVVSGDEFTGQNTIDFLDSL